MNTRLLIRRAAANVATLAMVVALAATPVAAGEDDGDGTAPTPAPAGGGGMANTAMVPPGPDLSGVLTLLGVAGVATAGGIRYASRRKR